MKIAFYAPMNAPEAGPASGDRALARLFMRALRDLGHEVEVAARTATYAASAAAQTALLKDARHEAAALVRSWQASPEARADLWFTYHVYYRAPDLLGPRVAEAFAIPYVIAEASDAPKHASSQWAEAYGLAHQAIAQADRVFALTDHDRACLSHFVEGSKLVSLPPFIDAAQFAAWRGRQREARERLRAQGLALEGPVLITVAMMRQRKKLASYQMLADSLRLVDRQWTLLIVGDGPSRSQVEAAFAKLDPARLRLLGARSLDDMPPLYAASDIYVWPGFDEAFGLAFLEAQATGVPAVAQQTRGIPSVVEHARTGLLTPVGDAAAFAGAVAQLLDDADQRFRLARDAAARIDERHTLDRAKDVLAAHLALLASR